MHGDKHVHRYVDLKGYPDIYRRYVGMYRYVQIYTITYANTQIYAPLNRNPDTKRQETLTQTYKP